MSTSAPAISPEQHLEAEPSPLRYPDVTVVCGTPELEDAHLDTLLNPVVVIEVLSPSTEQWDRGRKAAHYRRIQSIGCTLALRDVYARVF